MNVELFNPLRWNKKILLGLLGLVLVIWFLFVDVYSLKTRWDLGQQKKELIRKTEELKSESETLEQDIQKLENNPDLIEKIAREEYGMKKPGEKVYKIKKEE
jgi:cell division protein FtsB|tara:strand:- start:133 stop:438 length:306 start_codon:yes stop_codon:yes gene_type:complete